MKANILEQIEKCNIDAEEALAAITEAKREFDKQYDKVVEKLVGANLRLASLIGITKRDEAKSSKP